MKPEECSPQAKTVIVTGAPAGCTGITEAFLERGHNVVANSLNISKSELEQAEHLALVEGNVGESCSAAKITTTAMERFGSIDGVVNNAGIYFGKPFVESWLRFLIFCRGRICWATYS